jgi:hypothetical protein
MKMTKRCIGICLLTTLAVSVFISQANGDDRVPTSRIAEHAVCRALFAPPAGATAQVLCYLAFIDGISGSVFSGTPSEATAFFTLRTDVVSAQTITNGNIAVILQSAGTYDVYFNSSPHGDWNNPDSFSSGQRVATFTRTPPLLVNVGTMANGFFSAKLTSSQEFAFNGKMVDFEDLVPHGITWLLTVGTTPLQPPPGFLFALPFAGSALAIGSER